MLFLKFTGKENGSRFIHTRATKYSSSSSSNTMYNIKRRYVFEGTKFPPTHTQETDRRTHTYIPYHIPVASRGESCMYIYVHTFLFMSICHHSSSVAPQPDAAVAALLLDSKYRINRGYQNVSERLKAWTWSSTVRTLGCV